MRLLGYLLLFTLFSSTGWYLYSSFIKSPIDLAAMPYQVPEQIEVKTSKSYLISNDRELTFKLSKTHEKLWLQTTARLIDGSLAKVSDYQYSVVFYDTNDTIVGEHIQHSETSSEPITLIDEQRIPYRFFDNIDFAAGLARSIYFSTADYENADYLKVKLVATHEDVKDVAISVHQRVNTDANMEPLLIWQRLSEKEKANKAQHHALTADYLDPREQLTLAKKKWDPIGPEGIPGIDFSTATLYRLKNEATVKDVIAHQQPENLSDVLKPVTFVVHQETPISFNLGHVFSNNKAYRVTITKHLPSSGLSQSQTYELNEANAVINGQFDRGLVEITSTIPLSVSATGFYQDSVEEDKHFASFYLVNNANSLTFDISHSQDDLLPMKVQVNQVHVKDISTSPATSVDYQWLNDHNQVIKQGTIMLDKPTNVYHQLHTQEPNDQILQTGLAHFILPSEVKKVRISAENDAIVKASVSPTSLRYPRHLPEEKRLWFDSEKQIKRWYDVKPNDWAYLDQQGNKFLVRIYHQPVLLADEIVSGDYHSSRLVSESGNDIFREVILPYDAIGNLTQVNTKYVFTPIRSGQSFSDSNPQELRPQLLYIRDHNRITPAKISINKKVIENQLLVSQWGRLAIADLTPTNNKFTTSNNDAKWYVNYQETTPDSYYLRSAIPISSEQSITFLLSKDKDISNLLIRFYNTTNEPAKIRASIDAPLKSGAFDAYTRRTSEWLIAKEDELSGMVLQSNQQTGQEFRLPLTVNSDIDRGNYKLTIKLSGSANGLIAISETTLGATSNTPIYNEAVEDHD